MYHPVVFDKQFKEDVQIIDLVVCLSSLAIYIPTLHYIVMLLWATIIF